MKTPRAWLRCVILCAKKAKSEGRRIGPSGWTGAPSYTLPHRLHIGCAHSAATGRVTRGAVGDAGKRGKRIHIDHDLAGSFSPSLGDAFSDDQTEKDLAFESDGNKFLSDGGMGSVVGSIDGENRFAMTDSSFIPSSCSTRTSTGSSSFSTSDSVVYYNPGVDRTSVCVQKPLGMMVAIEIPGEKEFMAGKVTQGYYTRDSLDKIFEVVFRDGSKTEYGFAEIDHYRNVYLGNKQHKDCKEFMIMV